MDSRFFLVLTVEPAELALRPSSSAPYTAFSLRVEPAAFGSTAWVVGLVSSTIFVGSGTLVVGVGAGAEATLVDLRGAVFEAVRSDATGSREGSPSTSRVETAFLPSAAAGRSEGSFP